MITPQTRAQLAYQKAKEAGKCDQEVTLPKQDMEGTEHSDSQDNKPKQSAELPLSTNEWSIPGLEKSALKSPLSTMSSTVSKATVESQPNILSSSLSEAPSESSFVPSDVSADAVKAPANTVQSNISGAAMSHLNIVPATGSKAGNDQTEQHHGQVDVQPLEPQCSSLNTKHFHTFETKARKKSLHTDINYFTNKHRN